MKLWAGNAINAKGSAFSNLVTQRLRELGWEAKAEVDVTRLLRRGFDRDYGDIDVVAWSASSCRVLMIERKDVQYRKTLGEIAEQLADFRGEVNSDGEREHLRRHLDRIELITQHLPAVAKFVGIPVTKIESHLVFKNPVPMQYALVRLSAQIVVHTFDQLENI